MSPRGGYRGKQAVKKSRNLPTANITTYILDKERLKLVSEQLNVPVVEVVHRVLSHKDFGLMVEDISKNLVENWHEQDL